MFDNDDCNDDVPPDRRVTDDEIDEAVGRLVAAFGGGELVTVRPHDRQPLTAA